MKEILVKYPIKFLQQELINMRTGFKLERQKINDILKNMKSIIKLSKDDIIDLLIKYDYDISKLPPVAEVEPVKLKRGRKPKPKKEIIPDKYPKITDEEKTLKKELTGFVKPKTIYNMDYLIDKIDSSSDSINTKITKVKEELQFLKDYYEDRSDKRKETRNKSTTNDKIDKFLKYQDERIKKLESYLKTLINANIKIKSKL